MFKKFFLSTCILLCGSNIEASTIGKIVGQIVGSSYLGHCAADHYYTLAKKTSTQDESIIKKTHIYINALLVQAFFSLPFFIYTTKTTEKDIIELGKTCGKAAYASFILPAVGAIVLAYTCYFIAKKCINLIK